MGEFVGLPEYKPCLIDIPAAIFLDEFIVGPEPVNQAVRRKTDDAVGNGIDEFVVGEANSTAPLKSTRPLLTAVMDSRSRWLVGWSKTRTFEPNIIMRESIQRTRSPPESTSTFFGRRPRLKRHAAAETAQVGLGSILGILTQPIENRKITTVENAELSLGK